MADILSTKRNYRAAARPVFEDMWRLLERIRDDEHGEHEQGYGPRAR
jgi:hypothetical protein